MTARILLVEDNLDLAEGVEYNLKLDGYQVLRTIRQNGSRIPVIILSARGEEADKVRGFRLDADQYVTKPFSILELLERVAALLRRSARDSGEVVQSSLAFGDVHVDLGS